MACVSAYACNILPGERIMLCGYPVTIKNQTGTHKVACGRCTNCRINKKREWKGRLLLEAAHSTVEGSFITLTYNDQHLPKNGSVSVREAQLYIKRLRHFLGGGMRYFLVGEYGTKSWRPHYHILLFNWRPLLAETMIRGAWQEKGFVSISTINTERCNYVCDYTVKRMTTKEDPRLLGRNPEFHLQSRRPVIGFQGYNMILDTLYTRQGSKIIAEDGDVPHSFRIGGKVFPIPKGWRRLMRKEIGITVDYNRKQIDDRVIELSKCDELRIAERLQEHSDAEKARQQSEKNFHNRSRPPTCRI